MARRNLANLVSDVSREVRGQCTPLEAQQAIADALNYIDSKANWEFLQTETNLLVTAPTTTGTVAINALSTIIAGTGTSFINSRNIVPANYGYQTIKFASRLMPYDCTISTDTAGLLNQSFNALGLSGTTNITADAFVMYQMRYPLPIDCEPGRDLKIKGPLSIGVDGEGEIKKIEKLTFERYRQEWGISPGGPFYYTDGQYDEVIGVATIRFWPYPSIAGEYRLTYYKKLTLPVALGSTIMIPQAFERIPILLAAAQIMQTKNQSGWLEKKTMADRMMADMYARHAVSPAYDPHVYAEDTGLYENAFGASSRLYTRD